jgi:hypothetical protein
MSTKHKKLSIYDKLLIARSASTEGVQSYLQLSLEYGIDRTRPKNDAFLFGGLNGKMDARKKVAKAGTVSQTVRKISN